MLGPQGFIDLHTHGIGSYDTRTKKPEDILNMARLHAKAGTSAILLTIYSGTIQKMRMNIEAVRKAIKSQKSEVRSQKSNPPLPPFDKGGMGGIFNSSRITHHASRILGVHLEGPFLNPIKCGALDKDSFIKPTISNLKKLIEGYEDIIKIITIAPELPGALNVIEKCVSMGIKVNMGHSDATYKKALDGKKAGATGISHLFNAMRPFHHREPGLAGLGLLDEDLYAEVIADGIHIDPVTLRLIFKIKRHDRIILISDSIKAIKSKGGAVYPFRKQGRGFLSNGVYTDSGVLAGSAITMADALRYVKKLGIPEKVARKAAIENPTRYLTS